MADKSDRGDRSMSQQMANSWASFAKTGDPNAGGQPPWPRYDLRADVMREFGSGKNRLASGLKKNRVDYQIKMLKSLYRVE
jgi:para-nitrobenzyl esterase